MLLICAILLLRSSPNNYCDPAGTFVASGLILSGSLDLKLFLQNWFRSAVAFPKRAKASTRGLLTLYFVPVED